MPVKVVLTDIEGTTSSISFVKDVLFPFAREHLPSFVRGHADDPEVQAQIAAVCDEANVNADEAVNVLLAWIDGDRKSTPLKALQGMVWRQGYEDGTLKAHVYPDAVAGLKRMRDAGLTLAVYSSGSVPAQRLLFGHTEVGDLSGLFSAWFDTRIGSKKDAESYRRIAHELSVAPSEVLFASDVEAELDAARSAGVRTVQVARPEDGTVSSSKHPTVDTFSSLQPEAQP